MWCRSISTPPGSRSFCWCRLLEPASTAATPANQIVYVKSEKGFDVQGLFDPVYVTGTLKVSMTATGLADAGYSLDADKIELR